MGAGRAKAASPAGSSGVRSESPDPARRAAFEVLRAVSGRDAYANLALPAVLRRHRMVGREAAWATELTYGTLRGRGTYDAILATCVDRPLDALDPPVLDLLRLGTHQLVATRVPDHAAVSTTVALTRRELGPGPARLVNAVLRRVARDDLDGWLDRLAPPDASDPDVALAVRTSHPVWVVRALREALRADGRPDTQLPELLTADNEPAQVTLAVRPGRGSVETVHGEAAALGMGATRGRWSPWAVRLTHGDPGRLPSVQAGQAGVQDEGSQLVAGILASAPLSGSDTRWADLTAGPGGKAALLAGLGAQGQAASQADSPVTLTAVEINPGRARLVRETLAGSPMPWEVVVADARTVGADVAAGRAAPYDRVLLDAPCTGLGALRRRPEARWRRQPADVAALSAQQRGLLQAAVDATRPGGLIAYTTCSPHLAETRMVVDALLAERADLAVVDAVPVLARLAPDLAVGPGPFVQLWPDRHGTDAMFLALLRRSAS